MTIKCINCKKIGVNAALIDRDLPQMCTSCLRKMLKELEGYL